MWVDEFLAFMGRLKRLAGRSLRQGIAAVCERLALSQVRHLAIGKLSRGYRQRVAIAQALLNSPPLLILDEPTNGLDPRQIIEIRELIRTLAVTHTLFVTSHILGEVEKVAHRVVILLNGRLLTVQDLDSQAACRRLRLTVRGQSLRTVQVCLRAVPGVQGVTVDGGRCGNRADYLVHAGSLDIAELLTAALVANGFGVLKVREDRQDLETLFLQLTHTEMSP
jgi:ABC-2 type transport system ATP-binding protein